MKKSELKAYIRENIIETLSEEVPSKNELEDIENTIDRIKDKSEELGLKEDEDDKDAIKAAEKARGKNKKYDIVLSQLKDVETEMRSLAREYSKADGAKKEELLKKLKDLTGRKNELKKEVDKYADALV